MCRCWRVSKSHNLFEPLFSLLKTEHIWICFYFWTSDSRLKLLVMPLCFMLTSLILPHFSFSLSLSLSLTRTHTHCARGHSTGRMCTMKGICVVWFSLDHSKKSSTIKNSELTALPQQLSAACLTTSFRLPLVYSLPCLSVGLSFSPPFLSISLFTSSVIYLGSMMNMMSQKIVSFSFFCPFLSCMQTQTVKHTGLY